ncbi:Transcription factor LBX1 [Armadillidium nasatum]|uniref:Transcription factor LBX1 n=1 Tax=Armadillidium nasatum TaxID=96803 RepID=A0A5N5T4A8_9CRUS|nr:Transcription factor LBX1 [Armadillidium nasatum]
MLLDELEDNVGTVFNTILKVFQRDSANQTPLFSNKQSFKKKRKSRTAFTNHQIFELEKRFLYQKYLSPVDRDEIAQGLGLSNAQVYNMVSKPKSQIKTGFRRAQKRCSNRFPPWESFQDNCYSILEPQQQFLGILDHLHFITNILSFSRRMSQTLECKWNINIVRLALAGEKAETFKFVNFQYSYP